MILKNCLALALASAIIASAPALASPRENVLVLVNSRHEASAAVAERYRAHYELPTSHVLALDVERSDQISRADFEARIQQPVAHWFNANATHDAIVYIVLAPGFPVRVAGTVGRTGTLASVDSELAVLYRTLTGAVVGPVGPVRNPYFSESPGPDGQWPAFDRLRLDTFLVARIDGFTAEDALALVGRCTSASAGGRFVLDDRAPLEVREHRWFSTAAQRLTDALGADRVVFDRTLSTVAGETDVMGFYSWGAADPGNRARQLPLTFRPGAVVASLSSTDARTFVPPPDTWKPGSWQSRAQYYQGSPEWLVADFVRAGATGVIGNVADPYGDGAVRPDILFPAYVSGRTLGEAAWMATPSLSWQTVLVGDPLCRPFGTEPEAAPSFTVNEPSKLTSPFFDRVIAHVLDSDAAIPRAAVVAMTTARALTEQGHGDQARSVLDALATSVPDFVPGLVMRAQAVEATGDRQAAIDAYRVVLAKAADDLVALNNLAYLLIDEPGGANEALALSQRAYRASRGAPVVADTFGWVLLRTGDSAQAARVLRDAVASQPAMAELRIHLARALLAQGDLPGARLQWERAVAIDANAPDHAHAGPLRDTFTAQPPGA